MHQQPFRLIYRRSDKNMHAENNWLFTLSNTVMVLKSDQGHWNWYENVKLNVVSSIKQAWRKTLLKQGPDQKQKPLLRLFSKQNKQKI